MFCRLRPERFSAESLVPKVWIPRGVWGCRSQGKPPHAHLALLCSALRCERSCNDPSPGCAMTPPCPSALSQPHHPPGFGEHRAAELQGDPHGDLSLAQEVALSPVAKPLPCPFSFQGKLSPLPACPPLSSSFLPSSRPCPLLPTPHS